MSDWHEWLTELRIHLSEAAPSITILGTHDEGGGVSVVFKVDSPSVMVASGRVMHEVSPRFAKWPVEVKLSLLLATEDGERLIGGIANGSPYVLAYEQDAVHADGTPPEFHAWFRRLTGRDFPFALPAQATRHIAGQLFGSDFIKPEDLHAQPNAPRMPHKLNANVDRPYMALGHWGYGINTYAFYFTCVRPNLDVRARIGWGGAYADPMRQDAVLFAQLPLIGRLLEWHTPERGQLVAYLSWRGLEGSWTSSDGKKTTWEPESRSDAYAPRELEELLR